MRNKEILCVYHYSGQKLLFAVGDLPLNYGHIGKVTKIMCGNGFVHVTGDNGEIQFNDMPFEYCYYNVTV